jgi:hypothetical protein
MVEKYLYFRKGTAANTEVDEVTGSSYYPFSSFRGACAGTSDQKGAVTDDDNAVSLFFTPKASSGSGGDADDAQGDNVDVVILATAQYGQKAVIDNLLQQMVHFSNDKNEAILTVFDGYLGSEQNLTGITDIDILHVENAD